MLHQGLLFVELALALFDAALDFLHLVLKCFLASSALVIELAQLVSKLRNGGTAFLVVLFLGFFDVVHLLAKDLQVDFKLSFSKYGLFLALLDALFFGSSFILSFAKLRLKVLSELGCHLV